MFFNLENKPVNNFLNREIVSPVHKDTLDISHLQKFKHLEREIFESQTSFVLYAGNKPFQISKILIIFLFELQKEKRKLKGEKTENSA